jgi:hypothetical protein
MSITTQNLYSASYSAIETFLKGITNLDPRRRYRGNFIHASMPNINGKEFEGYPFIIIKTDIQENEPAFDGQISNKIFRCQLSIYCDDPNDIDGMSDKIASNFKDDTKLIDFKGRELSSSPIDYLIDLKGKKILYRNIWIIFRTRL